MKYEVNDGYFNKGRVENLKNNMLLSMHIDLLAIFPMCLVIFVAYLIID